MTQTGSGFLCDFASFLLCVSHTKPSHDHRGPCYGKVMAKRSWLHSATGGGCALPTPLDFCSQAGPNSGTHRSCIVTESRKLDFGSLRVAFEDVLRDRFLDFLEIDLA
jgi:hypothetical protein